MGPRLLVGRVVFCFFWHCSCFHVHFHTCHMLRCFDLCLLFYFTYLLGVGRMLTFTFTSRLVTWGYVRKKRKCQADDVPKKSSFGKFQNPHFDNEDIKNKIGRHSATNMFKKAECGLCHGCLRVVHQVESYTLYIYKPYT